MKNKIGNTLRTYPITFGAIFLLYVISLISAVFDGKILVSAVEFALSTVFAIIAFIKVKKNFKVVSSAVKSVNESINPKDTSNLYNFPMPTLIIDKNDNIIWYNDLFKEIVIGEVEPDISISEVFTGGLKGDELRSKTSFECDLGDKEYTVFVQTAKDRNGEMVALYYSDETELKNSIATFKSNQPCVLLAIVESIEEFSISSKDSDYISVSSDIERMIELWFSRYLGVFHKIGSGRFIGVMPKKEIARMFREKFHIVDDVRNYTKNGKKTGITLSIGIGREDTVSKSESSARAALDMALGRGGDQVASKTGDKYDFYGGLSEAPERRTRAKTRLIAESIVDLIGAASDIIIMGHKFSDLDSVGAGYGMYAIAKSFSKKAHIVINENESLSTELIAYLKADKDCFISVSAAEKISSKDTLLIICDTQREKSVEAISLLKKVMHIVIIDHHRKPTDAIKNAVLMYHEPSASSASEMVAELMQYIKNPNIVDERTANALLAGITLDTRGLLMKTGVRTYEAAAFLKSKGADPIKVKNFLGIDIDSQRAKSAIIGNAEIYNDFIVSKAEISSKDIRIIASQAADELLTVNRVKASFVMYKAGDAVNISARSLGDINVQLIMEELGGGGHSTMSAAQLDGVSFKEAAEKLKIAIDNYTRKYKSE